jgi:phosphate transport system substrate-binding protein
MNRIAVILVFILSSFLFITCNQKAKNNSNQESILEGEIKIYVDETVSPIVEDQIAVFESDYEAKIKMIPQSETETLNSLFKEKSSVAVLSRDLTKVEKNIFEKKQIVPRITKFATDGVAFITNKSNNDTLIALENVIKFMQGKSGSGIKGLVFDNANSSTVRYLNVLAGIKSIPENGVYTQKTNDEVIKYVAENPEMIGVVGVNWLSQPSHAMMPFIGKINILSVKGLKTKNYFLPTQNNLAEGKYPLARDLYIVNCQGFSGVGIGFSTFVAGDVGQRIVLKSGLLPAKIPSREISIVKNNK